MRSISAPEMKNIDLNAVNVIGIPEIVLMENAGRGAVDAIENVFGVPESVCVICGKGNNGGDGFVVARHLLLRNCTVQVFLMGKTSDLKGSSKINGDILQHLGVSITEIETTAKLSESINDSTSVVDALFGTGLKNDSSGLAADVISLINLSPRNYRVVSLEIPSGINPDTGAVMGSAVKADLTVTFCLPKNGMLISPGIDHCGKIFVKDIGVPISSSPTLDSSEGSPMLSDKLLVRRKLRLRAMNSNKGSSGKVLVIAGSAQMPGAASLTSKAAFRAGAGMVYLLTGDSVKPYMHSMLPECIVIDALGKDLAGYDSIVFGPGLGTDQAVLLKQVLSMGPSRPFLLDADGLNMLANDIGLLGTTEHKIVITPHPKEMSRLTKTSVDEIEHDRAKTAGEFAASHNITVLLKGLNSVIAFSNGSLQINAAGNPGMATAGSGDVLSGIIGAFLAQGISIEDAAVCGAFVHGFAGDLAAQKNSLSGLTATDIIELIPKSINAIMGVK